jgi:hypothetical protein
MCRQNLANHQVFGVGVINYGEAAGRKTDMENLVGTYLQPVLERAKKQSKSRKPVARSWIFSFTTRL